MAISRMARASGYGASLVALAAYTMSAPALPQSFHMVPSLSLSETLTNNVDLSPSSTRQGDLVTQITPGLVFNEKGARTKLDGFVSVPIALYLRTGGGDNNNIPSANNNIYPSANVLGDVALVQDFFHV